MSRGLRIEVRATPFERVVFWVLVAVGCLAISVVWGQA
jgi:hypothetical protein